MRRVAVIGRSGGGKSTLARALGSTLGLPVIHLDVLFWRPGWVESEPEPFRARLAAALTGDSWITDGDFMAAADLHLAGADTIIWVDQPRGRCLWRALMRVAREHGRSRADMAPGCEEKFDFQFLLYIWNWDRKPRARVEAAIAKYAPQTRLVRLRSDADIADFLASVTNGPS
ncbi:MAG: hypothetical protein ACHP7N_06950 [Caulobacterales bacterium]